MNDKPPLDRSKLGELYPKAKTYDEQLAERAAIHQIRAAQRPNHSAMRVSLWLTVCLGVALFSIWAVIMLLDRFGVLAGVFAAFLFVLAVVALVRWTYGYAIDLYEQYDRNARPFLLTYSLLMPVVLAVSFALLRWHMYLDILAMLAYLALHFVAISALANAMRNTGHIA